MESETPKAETMEEFYAYPEDMLVILPDCHCGVEDCIGQHCTMCGFTTFGSDYEHWKFCSRDCMVEASREW
jgi:hypothetical protein